jgi:hypothetical protein
MPNSGYFVSNLLGGNKKTRLVRNILWSRVFVILVAGSYLVAAYWSGEAQVIVATVIFLAFPVPMIWFADDLAPGTGHFVDWHPVNRPSAPALVKLFGFIILLAPLFAILVF